MWWVILERSIESLFVKIRGKVGYMGIMVFFSCFYFFIEIRGMVIS